MRDYLDNADIFWKWARTLNILPRKGGEVTEETIEPIRAKFLSCTPQEQTSIASWFMGHVWLAGHRDKKMQELVYALVAAFFRCADIENHWPPFEEALKRGD